MIVRELQRPADVAAVHRMWREAGWLKRDDPALVDACLDCTRGLVGEQDGEAECMALTAPGTVRHGRSDLPMGCVAAVITSRVGRHQGVAAVLTARAVAMDVASGAIVSSLGMFEQGFYNRLGFGTGGYVNRVAFEAATLKVPGATRPPKRLALEDFEAVHANRLARRLDHGSCTITDAGFTRAQIVDHLPLGFGLGYFDGPDGALSHHVWINPRDEVEYGPYYVDWMAWSTPAQFLELMGVLKNLGDQVPVIVLRESNRIQLQDLLPRPMRLRRLTTGSPHDSRTHALAYWQMRINDLPACLAKTSLPATAPLRFNLHATDPIEPFIDDDAPWRGAAGEYVVTLGPDSSAERGRDGSLPTLDATIGAFTRMWLGVRPASALSITDDLAGPPDLFEQLDWTLRLPDPQPDWDF